MRWLKVLLAINGIAFLFYAVSNTVAPSSFFLASDAPGYAVDMLRVLSLAYLAMGLIQLGTWFVSDRLAVQMVAIGSLVFEVGFGVLAATQGTASSDPFHQMGLGIAAGNAVVAALYAWLLYRTRASAA
ncbi:MAG: hypothetical protein AB1736_01000 [Chloroflexota bacterium]